MSKVLVADDEPDIRSFIALSLRLQGHEVFEASNGHEALSVIESGDPDIMFLDLRMPGMDGWEVLEAMRDNGAPPKIPIVVISAHASEETSKKCIALGCKEYLSKPFTPEQISQAVGRWARR